MAAELVVRLLLAVLRRLPFRVAFAISRACFAVLDAAVPRFRRIASRNLEIAGLPEPDRIIAGMWRSLARSLALFARFPDLDASNIGRWIRYEGFEYYDCAKKQGRGVLFATAHLGNWELSAFAHALLTEPMNVVVRPLDNARLDQIIERRRALSGNTMIGKRDAARSILRALRANEPVGALVDQNVMPYEGVFVDFFGVPACAASGLARLAWHSGATVIPGFAVWSEAESRYVLRFYEPVPMTGDTARDTQTVAAAVERAIREYPSEWLWIHRRWKTRPPGEPPMY